MAARNPTPQQAKALAEVQGRHRYHSFDTRVRPDGQADAWGTRHDADYNTPVTDLFRIAKDGTVTQL